LIKLDSLDGEYYFKRGYSFSHIDSTEASVADYLIAAKLNYRPDEAYFNMGLNFIALWDDSSVIYCFHKSLQYDDSENQNTWKMIEECKRNQKERKNRRNESTLYMEMTDRIIFEHPKKLKKKSGSAS